ncbi:MAG TPA: penicillin-binding transpeptidase domain-containing protein [Chitinispirillaceae bacterium]|nr:penicillin-binding transpeptidase domain-containing protein [Chitinispirillaceae bacterium]
MSDFSPMMRRISNNKCPKIKIPRKGRIRFLLIILLAAAAFKFGGALLVSGAQDSNAADSSLKKVNQSVEKKENPPAISKSDNQISFSEMANILKQSSSGISEYKDTIDNHGDTLVYHFSIDSSLQKLGNLLLKRYKPLYGAIIAIQPVSGRVLSIVSYKNDSVCDLGNLSFRSIFPAASIYKTITAAAAIEEASFNAQSMVKHAGRNHTLYKFQLEKELEQFNEITFEKAYAMSINPVFARIGMYSVGKSALENFSQKFAFNTAIPFELDVEMSHTGACDSLFELAELASGFNQQTTLSPLHGALMASAISEDGKMPYPFLVDSVTRNDSCIYKAQNRVWRTPIKKHTSEELRKMMSGVASYGTARKSFKYIRQSPRFDNIEYGGKTGSVDKDSIGRVDWFIGFARDSVDPNQRIAVGVVTAHGAFWTVHSSFIAAEYFRYYLKSIQDLQKKEQEQKKTVSCDSTAKKMNQRDQL